MSFSARTQMIAALAVSAVLIGSTASWGSRVYVETRASAQQQTQQVISAGEEQITALTERSADLELAISNATTILNDSSGKVLDENARQVLEKSISTAQAALVANKKTVAKLKTQLKSLSTSDVWEELLPTLKRDRAENSITINKKDVETLANNVIALGQGIQAVQATQAAWQAEQDRIAAEKAAAEAAAAAQAAAAARRAAQAKTLEQTGGSTTPTAPAPPANESPVTANFDAAAYIRALAPNANVIWRSGVCEEVLGYVVYLCGFAVINLNGVSTDPVNVYLDSTLTERYANETGLTVLVHEAAHARQFWNYGPSMLPNPTTAPLELGGRFPVEFMADCATIAYLGRSTGAYSGAQGFPTCNSAQIAEASRIW